MLQYLRILSFPLRFINVQYVKKTLNGHAEKQRRRCSKQSNTKH